MYTRIVVPLDGSDLAEQAIPAGEEMARAFGVPLHLVRVVEFPSASYAYITGAMVESQAVAMQIEDEITLAEGYLREIGAASESHGFEVTSETRHGAPVSELIDAMQPGDLFVLASHGRSGVARWFIGSVAEEVVRRATVPVLLVHATMDDARRRAGGAVSMAR